MIQVLIKTLLSFGTKVLVSLASEKLIEWTFFYLAGEIVKSTKTKHDDLFFDEIKKAYNASEKSEQPKDY